MQDVLSIQKIGNGFICTAFEGGELYCSNKESNEERELFYSNKETLLRDLNLLLPEVEGIPNPDNERLPVYLLANVNIKLLRNAFIVTNGDSSYGFYCVQDVLDFVRRWIG